MTWQDPSTDIENVNAAYRVQLAFANRYREALEEIKAMLGPGAGGCSQNGCAGCLCEMAEAAGIAVEALTFDPLAGSVRDGESDRT